MYSKGEFPTARKLTNAMIEKTGFTGKIKKSMCFTYRKTNNGRKYLLERSDVMAARTQFLRTMNDVRETGTPCIYYLDET